MREIILLLLVVASIPWCLKRPILALAIYLGANVLRPEMFFWGSHAGSYLFMVYSTIIIFVSFCGSPRPRAANVLNREFLLMIWLFLSVLISLFFSEFSVSSGVYYVLELLKGFVICAFIYLLVRDFDQIKMVQEVLLGCFALLGAWGAEQHFRGNERLEGLGGMAWGDSNCVASVFVLLLPVAFAKFFSGTSRRKRLTGLLYIAVIGVLIVCTKSRGGLVGMVAAVSAFGFFSGKLRSVAVAATVMFIVALPFATDSFIKRMQTMESNKILESSANSRLVLWQAGLMVFADHPVFGTGFLTYPEAKMRYQNRFHNLDPEFKSWVFRDVDKKVTHNTYLQMMSDCGLVGAIPFFLLIWGGISAGFRARRLHERCPGKREQQIWLCGISAGITGFAVCIMTIDSLALLLLYVQLVFTGILSRLLAIEEKTTRQATDCAMAYQEARS